MLVMQYKKEGRAKFISHLDLLKHVNKILKRGEISVEMSKGFNPHNLIYFSPATPIGNISVCDYLTVSTSMDKDEFMERFNKNTIEGIEGVKVYQVAKNPNFAGITRYGDYEFKVTDNEKKKIIESFENKDFQIKFMQKGEEKIQEVSHMMKGCGFDGDICKVTFALGNVTLRVDRYLSQLEMERETVKTNIYVERENELVEASKYLEEIKI